MAQFSELARLPSSQGYEGHSLFENPHEFAPVALLPPASQPLERLFIGHPRRSARVARLALGGRIGSQEIRDDLALSVP